MAKGFKFGGGSGSDLNFKVVGNPQPAAPAENTIWVDTDHLITAWEFSSNKPSEPVEGMVWFQTSAASVAQFNALKKNNITLYPNGSSQYVDGAWVGVDSRTYQNGVWVEWLMYLYNAGDECVKITGGWIGDAIKTRTEQYTAKAPTLTKNADHIRATMTSTVSCGVVRPSKVVDLTRYDTLYVDMTIQLAQWNTIAIVVYDDGIPALGTWNSMLGNELASISLMGNADRTTYALDVSGITGEKVVGVAFHHGDVSNTMNVDIYGVWVK